MSKSSHRLAVALNGYGLVREGRRDILPWGDLSAVARLAEELGYEAVFTPEIAGWEAFTTLTGLAIETRRMKLVTGVVPLAARTLERLAMGASSLQELSGGRFTVGVGSRMSIDDTRRALVTLRGMLERGQGTEWAVDPRPAPIYLAALGPRMTELAGEVADGVILNWATPQRVAEARSTLQRKEGFTIAVYVRACLSHDDERGTDALRLAAAAYAAMDPYRRQFEAMGVDASDVDRVIAATCVRGDRDDALARLREYGDAGADLVVVYPVPAVEAMGSLSATIEALGPEGA
jgi:alkanesulfonate monooxygenase SsuD/methylene tetrahydromethanopterin reductase-like flavin-dependent oxidoreductase (luciferase family)